MANLMLSLKMALISTGIISLAILCRASAPIVTEFVTSGIPSTYSLLLTFLRPPYLYLLINGIIISIFASSKLQHKPQTQYSNSQNPPPEIVLTLPVFKASTEAFSSFDEYNHETAAAKVVVAEDLRTMEGSKGATIVMDGGAEEEEQVKTVLTAVSPPIRSDSMEVVSLLSEKTMEKPPVSKRFGQRKTVKAIPEGKAFSVSKPKRHDTFEATRKTITEGRPIPLTNHLKKSDTWEQRNQKDQNASPPYLPKAMKESDTFNEHSDTSKRSTTLTRSSGSGKLKRDPSLSQDELNRRVEAFIKKFYEELRLQRQESLNQYLEMIKREAE